MDWFLYDKDFRHERVKWRKAMFPCFTQDCDNLIPTGSYLFTVNNRTIWAMCEICSISTIRTPERRHLPYSGAFIINFEQISLCFGVSFVDFEQVNA